MKRLDSIIKIETFLLFILIFTFIFTSIYPAKALEAEDDFDDYVGVYGMDNFGLVGNTGYNYSWGNWYDPRWNNAWCGWGNWYDPRWNNAWCGWGNWYDPRWNPWCDSEWNRYDLIRNTRYNPGWGVSYDRTWSWGGLWGASDPMWSWSGPDNWIYGF